MFLSRRVSHLALAGALALALAGGAAAQVVVLSAQGPSAPKAYPPGSVLPPGRVIRLEAGDRLEVVDSTGTRTITGPASVPAGQSDPGARSRLLDVFLKSQTARPRIAATRGFTLQPAAPSGEGPSLWQIDIAEGGSTCVAPGQTPVIPRGGGLSGAPVRIVRLASGDSRAIDFPPDARAGNWPAALPTTEGERYSIGLDDGSAVSILFRQVGRPDRGLDALAQDFLDKGCFAQLDRLRRAVAAPPG